MTAVAIIGAGYAGLACAVELARHDVEVTVFERSRTLGGRARVIRKDDGILDNGQHLLIGAYTELTRLLRLTSVSPRQIRHLPLTLDIPGQLYLRAAALPAPLHLLMGVVCARGLSWRERFAVFALLRHLKRRHFQLPAETTVTELLTDCRQPSRLRNLLWEPLCLAALNTPAHEASAQVFANILRDTLVTGSATASELLIPRIDLSELFPVPAARYLATRNGNILASNAITAITPDSAGFRLAGAPGYRIWPQVVIATAPHHAATLLDSTGACPQLAAQIKALPFEAITTIYLAFDPGVTLPSPMIGLADGPAQWAFDRGQCDGPEGLIATVISAPRREQEKDRNALVPAVLAQLERALGRSLPEPQWTRIITEKRATIACRPGLERPGIATPLPGLWLAGDYIESEYPATLESAVRAGVRCACEIMSAVRPLPQ
ncbi:MAG: hydroxysqualene dehydroxylase HpnE [Azoarcus sp.]|jgi:squalene-associated FAD-dependent desaturase|nr:hydroxysqualene dehydroxylase HpnE [Azoarcus sp.]